MLISSFPKEENKTLKIYKKKKKIIKNDDPCHLYFLYHSFVMALIIYSKQNFLLSFLIFEKYESVQIDVKKYKQVTVPEKIITKWSSFALVFVTVFSVIFGGFIVLYQMLQTISMIILTSFWNCDRNLISFNLTIFCCCFYT